MTTALYLDTRSRKINLYTVSVTEIPNRGLILRFGVDMGSLEDYPSLIVPMPVLAPTQGYSAKSTGGFVSVVGTPEKIQVLGFQGMPWQHNGALSIAVCPQEVVVIGTAATKIRGIKTHSNSSAATSDAAYQGIKVMAENRPHSVFILEGQSDYVRGWEVFPISESQRFVMEEGQSDCGALPPTKNEKFSWPEEHRKDIFTDQNMSLKYLSKKSKGQKIFLLALGAVSSQIEKKDLFHWVRDFIKPVVGLKSNQWEIFEAGAPTALANFLAEGYSFRVSTQKNWTNLEVTFPDGEKEILRLDLGEEGYNCHYVVEDILLEMAQNTDDEKVHMRFNRRADLLKKYLTRPLNENAEEYEVKRFEDFRTGGSYKLLAQHQGFTSETIQKIFNNPLFAEYANKANTIFVVSYDEKGKAQAAEHLEWGWDLDFGWQPIFVGRDMLGNFSQPDND